MNQAITNPADKCRLCGEESRFLQKGTVLDFEVGYFECPACGYVQTEAPHWLSRAYAEAISASDTGIMVRNQANARIVLATMMVLGTLNGTVVDCAGGYGILVRLLRDYGVNALWSDRYCKNLVARGFEHGNETADLVTAFEAFEHFEHPEQELTKLLAIAPNILLSTEIIPDPAPRQEDWWYYGKEHGQHVGFYRIRTLERLARASGKYLLTNGASYHLISDRPHSQALWTLLIRASRLVPILARGRLASKQWPDHELMSRRGK